MRWNPDRRIVELNIPREDVGVWADLLKSLAQLELGYDNVIALPYSEVARVVPLFLPSTDVWATVCFVNDEAEPSAYEVIGRAVRDASSTLLTAPYLLNDLTKSERSSLHYNFQLFFDPLNQGRRWTQRISDATKQRLLQISWMNMYTGILHSNWLTLADRYTYDAMEELPWSQLPWNIVQELGSYQHALIGWNENEIDLAVASVSTAKGRSNDLFNALAGSDDASFRLPELPSYLIDGSIQIRYNELHCRLVHLEVMNLGLLYSSLLAHIAASAAMSGEDAIRAAGLASLTSLPLTKTSIPSNSHIVSWSVVELITTQNITGGIHPRKDLTRITSIVKRMMESLGTDNATHLLSILLRYVSVSYDPTTYTFANAILEELESEKEYPSFYVKLL